MPWVSRQLLQMQVWKCGRGGKVWVGGTEARANAVGPQTVATLKAVNIHASPDIESR